MEQYAIHKAEESDILQIKRLQEASHFAALSDNEKEEGGFVSLETSIPLLKRINKEAGISVVLFDSEVVGYEFPLTLEHIKSMPLLSKFFQRLTKLEYKGKNLLEYKVVMEGQICISRQHKGKGLAIRLHKEFMGMLKEKYDVLFTGVSGENPRSLHVHTKKLGLGILSKYYERGKKWYILIQDISKI